jgi:hypothetical protein
MSQAKRVADFHGTLALARVVPELFFQPTRQERHAR